jgi:hypothetical protein
MRGDLSEMSAADACRDLARRGVTGALSLDGPDGPGRILLVDGRLIAAVSPTPRARLGDRLVGAGLLEDEALTTALRIQADAPGRTRLGALLVERGLVGHDAVRLFVQEQLLDAMFEIIGWRYGTFEFAEGRGAEVPEVPLQLSVDDALVEVARRQQEWEELSQLIPDLEAVPAFRDPGSTASASLEPDEFAVLASVDGDRSIRELAADLGYGEFEAARIIYGLALLGIIEVRLPEDEVGAALDEALAFFAEPPTGGEPGDEHDEDGEAAEAARPGRRRRGRRAPSRRGSRRRRRRGRRGRRRATWTTPGRSWSAARSSPSVSRSLPRVRRRLARTCRRPKRTSRRRARTSRRLRPTTSPPPTRSNRGSRPPSSPTRSS